MYLCQSQHIVIACYSFTSKNFIGGGNKLHGWQNLQIGCHLSRCWISHFGTHFLTPNNTTASACPCVCPVGANHWQLTATSSLIVSWSFSREEYQTNWKLELPTTLEVKSTAWNEMWDLLPSIQLCDCEIIAERGGEGYLTAQPWSPVAAQSVIVNTYLHHVNREACLIIHSLTCERQHVNTAPHVWVVMSLHIQASLCSIVSCIESLPNVASPAGREICSGREQEMSHQGLMEDRQRSSKLNCAPGPLPAKWVKWNMFTRVSWFVNWPQIGVHRKVFLIDLWLDTCSFLKTADLCLHA